LRRLEEMELTREHAALLKERAEIVTLLGSDRRQWTAIARQLREVQKQFGKDSEGGARRSQFAVAERSRKCRCRR
jgi:topoisomerase IV subunit A